MGSFLDRGYYQPPHRDRTAGGNPWLVLPKVEELESKLLKEIDHLIGGG